MTRRPPRAFLPQAWIAAVALNSNAESLKALRLDLQKRLASVSQIYNDATGRITSIKVYRRLSPETVIRRAHAQQCLQLLARLFRIVDAHIQQINMGTRIRRQSALGDLVLSQALASHPNSFGSRSDALQSDGHFERPTPAQRTLAKDLIDTHPKLFPAFPEQHLIFMPQPIRPQACETIADPEPSGSRRRRLRAILRKIQASSVLTVDELSLLKREVV